MRVLIRPCYLNFNKWLSIERPEIGMVSPDIINLWCPQISSTFNKWLPIERPEIGMVSPDMAKIIKKFI